jgi:geranylgeranyl pyrophosphate synthase/adenylate kinase family enzyme
MDMVLFTGYSCSGKTTVSNLLAQREGYHLISIHPIISNLSKQHGYARGRELFRNKGVEKTSFWVAEYLAKYLSRNNFDKVVIDDIYDNCLLSSIFENFPCEKKVLIALETNYEKRLTRMSGRICSSDDASEELKLYDLFKNEANICSVIEKAHYKFTNDDIPLENLYDNIVAAIKQEKSEFKSYISNARLELTIFIEKYFENWYSMTRELSDKIEHLLSAFIKLNRNGKRLRGILVKLGYNLTNKESKNVLFLASAYEIFQTSILAHDDIIDQSLLRRGMPSLHAALGNNHYGISQAICLGDVGLFLSGKIIADSPVDDLQKPAIIKAFMDMQYKTALGELLDIELPEHIDNVKVQDILIIYEYKTAYYTIIGPLQLGAILGGADESLLQKIHEFGKNLGIAFQIKDDILGIFGDKDIIGKSNTSDIEEGKITLLWYYALKNSTENQKRTLNSLYGKKDLKAHEINTIKEIMHETGSLKKNNDLIDKYANKARSFIKDMPLDNKYKKILHELCDYMIARER